MRTLACRLLIIVAMLGCCAPFSFGQADRKALSDRELLALVAGNALSENIVHEIETRSLDFLPSDQFRALAKEAGADSRVIAALNNAKPGSAAPANSDGNGALLQHLAEAGKFLQNRQYDEATRALTAAMQNGGGVETGFVMTDILRAQEEWSSAEAILMEVMRQSPDFPETHSKLSYLMYRTGDGEGSLREARIALSDNPNDAEAHKNAGLALQILNKFNASEVEYAEALRLKPDYEAVRLDLGVLYSSQGKIDAAIVEYKKAISLNSNDWLAHVNLGVEYDNKGDLDSAIREYRQAKTADPKRYAPRQSLGHALMSRGMNAEAVKEFRELEAMAPDSAVCHICLGGALYNTWDLKGAEKEYRTALALDPSDADAYGGLGNIRYQQKDYDGALEEFRQAEKLDPTSYSAFLGEGLVMIAKRDYSGAIEELKRAGELKPSSVGVHENLGHAFSGLGNDSGAIAEYKQAVALDPKQANIRLELAAALEKKGDWIEALDQYHQAAVTVRSPEMQDRYMTAQGRFNQHVATLKASGKSAEAAGLESRLRAAKVDPGISERLDAAMEKVTKASAGGIMDGAEKDYKDAVSLAEKLQPPDDRLEKCLVGLAYVYAVKKDFAHAEEALQRALKVTEELHGAESPVMAEPLQALGRYMIMRQNYDSAFNYFSRTVALNEKTYGEASSNVAVSLMNLSQVYQAQNDYAKAEPYLLRAVKIDESLYGADGSEMKIVLWSLCDLYDKWGKSEKAEPRYRQMLAVLEGQFGPDSPVLLSTLTAEAKMLRQLNRPDDASKYDQHAQSIRTATGIAESGPVAQLPK